MLLTLSIFLLSSIVIFQFCYFPVLLLSILLLSSFVTVQNCYFPVLIFSSCDAFLLSSLDQFPPFHASALQSTDCSRCEGGSRINQSFEERVRVEKFSHVPPAQRVRWTWLALAPIRVILMDASGRSERNYHTKRAISPTVAANLRHPLSFGRVRSCATCTPGQRKKIVCEKEWQWCLGCLDSCNNSLLLSLLGLRRT